MRKVPVGLLGNMSCLFASRRSYENHQLYTIHRTASITSGIRSNFEDLGHGRGQGQGHKRCPRGVLEVEASPRGPRPCITYELTHQKTDDRRTDVYTLMYRTHARLESTSTLTGAVDVNGDSVYAFGSF